MTVTPHHVGQVTKAEILVTHLLDTAPAGTTHERQAKVIVQQLQDTGWKTPPDPAADIPPLRPDRPALDDDSPGRREFRAARNALANRPRPDQESSATHRTTLA